MATAELGQLEQVDVRDVWPNETQDFTPWLAEHLDLLSSAIGLDLERVDTEVPVGGFSLDILANSEVLGPVAIENQLGSSDHGHLGQLATYAAGVDAKVLVWVAATFRPEHLKVIDWLNHWSPSKVGIFAVEVRALKVGNSLPAADFRAIASPKDWAGRQVSSAGASGMTDDERKRRIDFFDRLVAGAHQRGLAKSASSGSVARDKSFPCGVPERGLLYWISLRTNGVAAVQLEIRTGEIGRNDAIVQSLLEEQHEIDRDLQFQPEYFRPDPDGRHGRQKGAVITFRETHNDWDPAKVEATIEWCLKALKSYQRVLEPKLSEIIERLDAEKAPGVEGGLGGQGID